MKTEKNNIYKKLYYTLFNAVTDAIRQLEQFDAVECRRILIKAQQQCEEIFISDENVPK